MNAALKRAESQAIRMSEAKTNANPPPDAAPLTAAMTGLRNRRSRVTTPAIRCW